MITPENIMKQDEKYVTNTLKSLVGKDSKYRADIASTLSTRIVNYLDIFAKNAHSSQAKTQVELAQSIFMLPRLTGLWTHLSKQKGGIGMKGPGETEIETDRRALRNKISLLKEKLKHIEKIGITQRSGREGVYRAALVGYTNVGKSTIMNLLSRSDVLVEDKLFATLDATVR
jgi:GTP-binding protein HflX